MEALGDVDHYVEPFALGSLAVLLRRPHEANRTYHSETVNDLDGLLCNAWRSIQWNPEATADAASWPVCGRTCTRDTSRSCAGVRSGNLSTWRTRTGMTRDGGLVDVGTVDLDRQRLVLRRGGWVVGADGRIEKRKDTPKRLAATPLSITVTATCVSLASRGNSATSAREGCERSHDA